MNRQSRTSLLAVALLSSLLCACVTYSEADYYVLSQDEVKRLASENGHPPADSTSMEFPVNCEATNHDEIEESTCDTIRAKEGMLIELWRPGFQPVELSALEFSIDDDAIYDLDGQRITYIDNVDRFALQTSQTMDARSRIQKRHFWAGVATTGLPLGTIVIVGLVAITQLSPM